MENPGIDSRNLSHVKKAFYYLIKRSNVDVHHLEFIFFDGSRDSTERKTGTSCLKRRPHHQQNLIISLLGHDHRPTNKISVHNFFWEILLIDRETNQGEAKTKPPRWTILSSSSTLIPAVQYPSKVAVSWVQWTLQCNGRQKKKS